LIPITLTLKNFMSYKNLELDFSEIHVACLSGENGAGKSSILDAITWCLWDKARAPHNEDLIRLGEAEMSAELVFRLEERVYRILRSTKKMRGKRTSQSNLEFQVLSENGYKALTGKTIKETQTRIIETVKMDYQTFVNSAFILQGKADEFTTKSPIDRKRVLAEILNLSQYDILQERAKEKLKEIEIEKAQTALEISRMKDTIADEELIRDKLKITEKALFHTEDQLKNIEKNLLDLLSQKEICTSELSVLNQINKTYLSNKGLLAETDNSISNFNIQLAKLTEIIDCKAEIEEKYEHLIALQQHESALSNKLMKYSELETLIHNLREEINNQKHLLELELQKIEEKVAQYQKEKSEHEKIIKDKEKILEAYRKLEQARIEEADYQKKSALSQKLSEKKYVMEKKLQEEIQTLKISESSIQTKIADRKSKAASIEEYIEKQKELNLNIEELDKIVVYRDSIKDKGTKLNTSIEHNKKTITDKQQEISIYNGKIKQWSEIHEANCPMCNTYLDETDKKKIVEKYQQDILAIEQEIENLQLENSRLEKQTDEYRELYKKVTSDLKGRDILQKQLGEIEQSIAGALAAEKELVFLEAELSVLLAKLETNEINPSLQEDIRVTDMQLAELEYNPEKLATLQAKVNDWKWAELKYSQLETAENKLAEIENLLPDIAAKMANTRETLAKNLFALDKEDQLKIRQTDLLALDYRMEEHQALKAEINILREYEGLWKELQEAILKSSSIKEQIASLNINKLRLENELAEDFRQIEKIPELNELLFNLVKRIDENNDLQAKFRAEENSLRTDLVKNTEKLEQNEKFKEDIKAGEIKLNTLEYESKLHKELVLAFGKNGIQAVIIENAIPEIEHAANSLLNRMTEGRMNVSFTTRKANKSNEKISETLDIYISDELGTRNYEMYSGGEAFRVNFSIRLALSKLLARRAGTKLKTLVIDEGFGTQDTKGLSRLVEAINTVSGDFEKILIITHMNDLKEAFPAKMEVYKTIHGSEVRLFT
jgi:exonuclease SbcC